MFPHARGALQEWGLSAWTKEDLWSNKLGSSFGAGVSKKLKAIIGHVPEGINPRALWRLAWIKPFELDIAIAKVLNDAEPIEPKGWAKFLLSIDATTVEYMHHQQERKPGFAIFHKCLCDGQKARPEYKAARVTGKRRGVN